MEALHFMSFPLIQSHLLYTFFPFVFNWISSHLKILLQKNLKHLTCKDLGNQPYESYIKPVFFISTITFALDDYHTILYSCVKIKFIIG